MSVQDLANEAWFHQLDVVIEVILIVGSLHWCMPVSVCVSSVCVREDNNGHKER